MRQPYDEAIFRNDDECVKFYTGLPNFAVLKTVFDFTAPVIMTSSKLTSFQDFVLLLMKLRLDNPFRDLHTDFSLQFQQFLAFSPSG